VRACKAKNNSKKKVSNIYALSNLDLMVVYFFRSTITLVVSYIYVVLPPTAGKCTQGYGVDCTKIQAPYTGRRRNQQSW